MMSYSFNVGNVIERLPIAGTQNLHEAEASLYPCVGVGLDYHRRLALFRRYEDSLQQLEGLHLLVIERRGIDYLLDVSAEQVTELSLAISQLDQAFITDMSARKTQLRSEYPRLIELRIPERWSCNYRVLGVG